MTRLLPIPPNLDERLSIEFLAHTLDLLPFSIRQDAPILNGSALRMDRPEPPRDLDLPLLAPKSYPRPELSLIEATVRALMPPPPLDAFLGRKSEVDQAANMVLSGRAVVITGARGMGKTALLRQLASDARISKSFKHIWWLDNLENAGSILGLALNSPAILRAGPNDQPRLAREFLIGNHVLLIVDGVSPDEVDTALAFAPSIAIGTTSYSQAAPVNIIEINGLSPDPGTQLLMQLSGKSDSVARPLGTLVGYRPRALTLIAAMMAEDGVTPQGVAELVQNASDDQLSTLYNASFEALPEDYQALCQALAVTPGQWISVDTVMASYDKPLIGQRALTFLEKRGFIERVDNTLRTTGGWLESVTPAETGFKPIVHPVTRFFEQGSSANSAQGEALHVKGLSLLEEGYDAAAEESLSEALQLRLAQDTEHAIAETLVALARLAYLRGDDAAAIRRLEEAAERLHTLRDEESLEVVRVALSRVYRRAGRLDAALSVLGNDAPPEDLALVYRARGEWNEAVKVYQRWIESEASAIFALAETLILAGRYPEALLALNGINSFEAQWLRATICHIQGDLQKALDLYQKIRVNVPQQWRGTFARAIGRALAATGQVYDAVLIVGAEGIWYEGKYSRPIFARQRSSYALLAHLNLMQGKTEEAEEAARLALKLTGERANADDDAILRRVLGRVSWQRGELDSALIEFDAELSARGSQAHRDDHEIGVTLHNIADIQRERGDADRAIANYRRALSHKDVGKDPRSVLITRLALRDLLIELGRDSDALEAGQQAVDLVTQRGQVELPALGHVLAAQAQALQITDRSARANQLINEWATRLMQRMDEAIAHPLWEIRVLAIGVYLRSLPSDSNALDANTMLDLAQQAHGLAEDHAPDSDVAYAARRDLGNVYLRLEQWDQSYDAFKPLVPDDEALPIEAVIALSAHLGLAQAAMRLGKRGDAFRYFDNALAYEPDDHARGLIVRQIADMYAQAGDDRHAASRYVQALELLQQDRASALYVDTVVTLAYTRLRLRNFGDAIDTFEQALAIVEQLPTSDPVLMSSVLFDMATAHYTLGQYRRAADTYQRALTHLDAKRDVARCVEIYTALAHCYVELETFQEALTAYHDALQFDGINASQRRSILAEQADVFVRIGLVQSAIDTYRAALALENASVLEIAMLHRGLGTLYAQLDMHNKAQEHFEAALAAVQDEQTGPTLHALGDVYRAQGQLEQAIATYDRAAQQIDRAVNPVELAATKRALGEIYLTFENPEEALVNLEAALEIERALPQQDGGRIVNTLDSLARAYEMKGSLDLAIRRRHEELVYQDARYTPEGYVDTLRELGRLYMQQRHLEDAAKAYEEALGTAANQPMPDTEKVNDMTNALADVYRAQGRLEDAAKLYRQVMAVISAQAQAVAVTAAPMAGPLQSRVAEALQLTEADIARHIQTLNAAEQSWKLLNRVANPDLKALAFVRALQAQTCAALGRGKESDSGDLRSRRTIPVQ